MQFLFQCNSFIVKAKASGCMYLCVCVCALDCAYGGKARMKNHIQAHLKLLKSTQRDYFLQNEVHVNDTFSFLRLNLCLPSHQYLFFKG